MVNIKVFGLIVDNKVINIVDNISDGLVFEFH